MGDISVGHAQKSHSRGRKYPEIDRDNLGRSVLELRDEVQERIGGDRYDCRV
jgi:hypothetical protein